MTGCESKCDPKGGSLPFLHKWQKLSYSQKMPTSWLPAVSSTTLSVKGGPPEHAGAHAWTVAGGWLGAARAAGCPLHRELGLSLGLPLHFACSLAHAAHLLLH